MYKFNKKFLIVILLLTVVFMLPSCKKNNKDKTIYSIEYVVNGGFLTNQPLSYDGSVDVLLTVPIKDGYEFKGWYDNDLFVGNPISVINKGEKGNKTFYAKWGLVIKNEKYAISFVTNGGILSDQPINYTKDEAVNLPIPTKEEYIFDGWYETKELIGNKVERIEKGITGNKVFYAKWVKNPILKEYQITFVLNGGTILEQPTCYTEGQEVILPTAIKDEYIFDGWYETKELTGNEVGRIEKGTTGDKVFYAKWVKNPILKEYQITFVLAGGTILEQPISYTEGQEVILPTATKDGYIFDGWYETKELTGNKVERIEKGTTGNKVFFAKWSKVPEVYLITFITNGGILLEQPINYDETMEVILPIPTKDGYMFDGWYENQNCYGAKIEKIEEGSTGHKVFYAKWKEETYAITFVTNGGILYNQPIQYNIFQEVILPIPTKEGFIFSGWYETYNYNGNEIEKIEKGSSGDKVFYAKWIYLYNISYVLNGGTLIGGPVSYDGKLSVTLPTPTRDGYAFDGWYDNAQFSGSAVVTIVKGSTGDKTFYAKWIEKNSGLVPVKLNRLGFDGQGMSYVIKAGPIRDFDPYAVDYTGTSKALKQAHQADVEDAYNIRIEYSEWDNDAQWGPARVNFIKTSFIDKSFEKKNVYAVNITSQWIPTLVKASCLAELYNYDLEEGIFADYDYEQNSTINESVAVRSKVYGYQPGSARPDYFLYYNATKIASIGMPDPAEMWFKGEWNWSNFDQWVKDAQVQLGSGEFAIDCGYAEFIIGAAPAQGNQLVNASRGTIMFTKSAVTNIVDKMKAYYKEGYWDTKHGVQDVATNFKVGKTLLHTGSLWFLKEPTRFTPYDEETGEGITFEIGMVPYPIDDNTTVTPYTAPYSYEDTEGKLVEVNEPLTTRTNETLTTNTGEPIYGIDLSESNFKIPYTGSSCYSLINYAGEGQNGINTSIAFCILHDLLSDMAPDPDDEGLTADDGYRLYLNKKLDKQIDVEVVMSVQDSSLSYYELMEVLSMTVGDGSHFGPNGFWLVASGMMSSEDTPATKLKEIEPIYKEVLESLGY